jgi:hypothetical protein
MHQFIHTSKDIVVFLVDLDKSIEVKIAIDDSTDWDFYVSADQGEIISTLINDFGMAQSPRDKNELYPYDILTTNILYTAGVQIVVRSDCDIYTKVLEQIPGDFYRDFLWKSGPNKPSKEQIQRILDMMFTIAGATPK